MLRPEDNLFKRLSVTGSADAWMRKASSMSRTLALMIRWISSASVLTGRPRARPSSPLSADAFPLVPDLLARPMRQLDSGPLYDLYCALSGDKLREDQTGLWAAYKRRVKLRNDIVHSGAHAMKAQAVEACDSALDLIHHFETVHARVLQ